MIRSLFGYAIFAVVAFIALKLVFGLLGFAFGILGSLLWLAFIGFVFYLILKLFAPATAARVKEAISGKASNGSF